MWPPSFHGSELTKNPRAVFTIAELLFEIAFIVNRSVFLVELCNVFFVCHSILLF